MTPESLTLYDFELDEECYRVRLVLALLGLNYKRIAVDMFPGKEHQQPHILALSPKAQMPILDMAQGKTIKLDAEADEWVESRGSSVHAGLGGMVVLLSRYRNNWVFVNAPNGMQLLSHWSKFVESDLIAARDARLAALFGLPGDLAALTLAARKALRTMDDDMTHRHFEGAEWFVGDGPSIVDIALYPSFALSRDYGLEHDAFPALRRWARRIRALPGFITMPGIPDYA